MKRWRAWAVGQYQAYHPTIWLLTGGRLFNSIIQFMAMPFLTMYLAEQHVDTAVIGLVQMFGPIGSTIGNLVGGQLSDRIGRKPLMVAGILFSGAATAAYSLVHQTWQFATLFALQGLFGALFWPSSRAAIADLTPPEKRADAYGLWRVMNNVGAAVGPLLGGLIGQHGFMFGLTGIADMIYAMVFLLLGVESLPGAVRAVSRQAKDKAAIRRQNRREWRQLLGDHAFTLYILAGIFATIAYQQMYGNYSLYVDRFSAHPDQTYAWMLSLNGLLVVVAQIPINYLTRNWSAGKALVIGTLTYACSYALFAIPGADPLVLGASVIWTVGEMIVMTAQMTFVADLAPEALRGRYMGASSISWTVGALLCGPFGTQLLKHFGGGVMMLGAAAITLLGTLVYRISAVRAGDRLRQGGAVSARSTAAH